MPHDPQIQRLYDAENIRRQTSRAGLPDGDRVRFFKTVRNPVDGSYPRLGNTVYGLLLKNVSFPREAEGGVTYDETASYAWLGIPSGPIPELGSVVIADNVGARWWIRQDQPKRSKSDPNGLTTCADELYSVGCQVCPCTADPWILNFTDFACTDVYEGLYPFHSGIPVFFSAADSTTSRCVWLSETYSAEQYSWQWKMTAISLDPPTNLEVSGTLELMRNGTTVLSWSADRFCCACESCFLADCNLTFPIPCPSWPKQVCISAPIPGQGTVSCALCGGGVASYAWTFDPTGSFTSDAGTPILVPSDESSRLYPACGWLWSKTIYSGTIPNVPLYSYSAWLLLTQPSPPDPTRVYELRLIYSTGYTAYYRLAGYTFNCTAANVFTFFTDSNGATSAPYPKPSTITLEPADVVTDDDGNVIVDAGGGPISLPSHDACSPGTVVECCYTITLTPTGYMTYSITLTPVGGNGSLCSTTSDSTNPAMAQASAMLEAYLNSGGPNPNGAVICYSIGGG